MDTLPKAEVVWIEDECRLVDGESYERRYRAAPGQRPAPGGYYVVRWPAGTPDPGFMDESLSFEGPYGSRRAAESACGYGVRGER